MVVMPIDLTMLDGADKKAAGDVLRRFTIEPHAVDRIVERGKGTLHVGLDFRAMNAIREFWDFE